MTLAQSPYLRDQRQFPVTDLKTLAVENDRAYIDIASKVNARTIGIFALNNSIITGESWYLAGSSQRQQTLRKLFTFTTSGTFPHGIDFTTITGFTKIYGTFTNGTNWFPLPFVDVVSATNQVGIRVNPTNVVITAGAGAPTITSGFVILEWLSQF